MPAAWLEAIFNVAPTSIVWVPVPLSVPVVPGLLVNAVTVIVLAPDVTVVAEDGSVIE